MKIVLFTHPNFLNHQSMPRFASMIYKGMLSRGHQVEVWTPTPVFFNYSKSNSLKKWLGYIDQYIVFPKQIKDKISQAQADILFVFCDQALGPWVPLVKRLKHVIHCHDFLAQKSALGLIPEHTTSLTGKLYQKFIHRGYSKGKNFISVSNKTKSDLSSFLESEPQISEVVYNGFNRDFSLKDNEKTRNELSAIFSIDLDKGYILHVGGNQWYKNRLGIIDIYDGWRAISKLKLPLILVGEQPNIDLNEKRDQSNYKKDIFFLSGVEDNHVALFYAGASVFLFPSLAEGFGWPIAEAMASGTLVITTNEAPMNEVASDAGFYISLKPNNSQDIEKWKTKTAFTLEEVLHLNEKQREEAVKKGIANAKRFDQDKALDAFESIYKRVLEIRNDGD